MWLSRFASLAVAFVFAVAAPACAGAADGSHDANEGGSGVRAVNASTSSLLPATVDELPDMDPEGYRALLAELRRTRTPVVVNVWGSWCGPCRIEAPELAAAAGEFGERVQFLGVDILDDRAGARAFIREFDWPYPSVYDPSGAIRDDLGYLGQPVTVFYDARGRRVADWVGPLPPDTLNERLRALLD